MSKVHKVERVFIGAGCNRIVNNVSWGASGLVSFGAHNAVAIFCPRSAQILTTLPGHKAAVNCTYWLPNTKFAFKAQQLKLHYLLSGDADGLIMLWEYSLGEKKWRHVLAVPEKHKKGVTCISGVMLSTNEAIYASTSSDGTVNVWEIILPLATGDNCKLSHLEALSIGSKTMVSLALAELPGNTRHVVLAMGGLDNKVHLYSGERTGKFLHACELKGHSDWIRNLDFSLPVDINNKRDTLLLVSSSQDKTIRIWKLVPCESPSNSEKKGVIGLSSYIEGPILVAGPSFYQISLESLLIGHEDWVYSVQWEPPSLTSAADSDYIQPQSILSASMDKTMMIWQPERTSGIWMNVVTVGELGNCALGFYGGHWSPNGDAILAHGYGGSFHLWKDVGVDSGNWQPQRVPSGHYAAVSDISWARSGKFLLSVSHDQAQKGSVAEIWLWEVGSWKAVGRLQSHNLTVTHMEFSHDDNLLLSVSRDRQFSIFSIKRSGAEEINYELVAMQEAHKRIIWACSWNPFGHEFATGSRDKTVKIWGVENESSIKLLLTLPPFPSSVTALSWLGVDRQSNHGLLAIGLESGLIELWRLSGNCKDGNMTVPRFTIELAACLDSFMCDTSTVQRLAWRNSEKVKDCHNVQLASGGADNCVRVFEVNVS